MAHFTGSILADIAREVNASTTTDAHVGDRQSNGAYGIHQALVTIPDHGGDTHYRLLLAPMNAPIEIAGRPVDDHFPVALTKLVPVPGLGFAVVDAE
jgi:hypothetical protein